MTLDELYAEMDLYGFDDFEDSQKLLLLNESYFDVVTREPWPFMEKLVSFTAANGTTQILVDGSMKINNATGWLDNANTIPATYTEYDVTSVLSFVDLTRRVVMTPERNDVIEKNYVVNNLSTYPEKYYFIGEDMFVYPSVVGNTQYQLLFLKDPKAATEATDTDAWFVPSRHHSVILYNAMVKAFLVNDDPQASMFQNMFESRYQQMRNDVWMKQYDRTDRIYVTTDSYDWSY